MYKCTVISKKKKDKLPIRIRKKKVPLNSLKIAS